MLAAISYKDPSSGLMKESCNLA